MDLHQTNQRVRAAITVIIPAGDDEISAAVTELFNAHGGQWQALAAQARRFSAQFSRALVAAGAAYHATEAANAAAVGTAPLGLVMGGTGTAYPDPGYLAHVSELFLSNSATEAVRTPEQFFPLVGNLTYGQSLSQGLADLRTALQPALATGGAVTVFGHSQSSTIATEEIRSLMAAGSPHVQQLPFVLTGDPNNPVGGLAERFTGAYLPGLNVPFNGATPPDSPYHTLIFTNQYKGVADFPQYPLNLVSDANALAGIAFGAHEYAHLPPTVVAGALTLPTSPGYTGGTRYVMALTQNLPLVQPLREWLPAPYGNAAADLLQPDLRVLADLGYGSGQYANIPTPASLFEVPNPATIGPALFRGTIQGPQAALVDLGLLPRSDYPLGQYPFSPVLDPGLNLPLPQTQVTGLPRCWALKGTSPAGWDRARPPRPPARSPSRCCSMRVGDAAAR